MELEVQKGVSRGCWELHLGALQEQQVLLAAASSLQPHIVGFAVAAGEMGRDKQLGTDIRRELQQQCVMIETQADAHERTEVSGAS